MEFASKTKTASGAPLPRPRKEIARLLGLPGVRQAFGWFRAHESEVAAQQLELTAIPAPPFHEQQRAGWMLRSFQGLGLQRARQDQLGNVIGELAGTEPAPYVAVSAHLDTVFSETTLDVRREGDCLIGPGISDNGAGLAALLAIAGALRHAELRTRLPLLFLANVGEEGEGNLRGMRHVFADPQWQGNIACMLVLDGAGTETIVAEALGSRRFEVAITGPGGHSWSDFGAPNPIVLLARVIGRLNSILLPLDPKTTLNVGVIEGGTSVNAIPESAQMRVDIRSTDPGRIDAVERQLQAIVDEVMREAEYFGNVEGQVRLIGERPAAELPASARLLEVLRAVDAKLAIPSHVHRASTDANIPLSLGVPALAIGAGGTGARAHTLQEWFNPHGRELALRRILLTLLTLAEVVNEPS